MDLSAATNLTKTVVLGVVLPASFGCCFAGHSEVNKFAFLSCMTCLKLTKLD